MRLKIAHQLDSPIDYLRISTKGPLIVVFRRERGSELWMATNEMQNLIRFNVSHAIASQSINHVFNIIEFGREFLSIY